MKKAKIKEKDSSIAAKKKFAKKVLNLFGQEKDKHLFLTREIITKVGKIRNDHFEWIMSYLVDGNHILGFNNKYGSTIYLFWDHLEWYTAEELLSKLSPEYFDTIGKNLKAYLTEKSRIDLSKEFFEKFSKKVQWPVDFVKLVVAIFIESGLICKDKYGKIGLVKRHKDSSLGHDQLERIMIAASVVSDSLEDMIKSNDEPFASFSEFVAAHNKHQQESKLKRLAVSVDKPEIKIQHICQLLLGHQDTDLPFLEQAMAVLEKQEAKERPDLLVTSGLIIGSFKFQQKNRRRTLSIKNESQQFSAARLFLEMCKKLGIAIIYNMSASDFDICTNHTVDSLRTIHSLAPQSEKRSLNFLELDKLKQTKEWDVHFNFWVNVAYEYQLRIGRCLYSAEECLNKFGVEIEEYLMLLKTYLAFSRGEGIPEERYAQVLQVENIPLPNKAFTDFTVVDDFLLEAKTKSEKVVILNKRDFNLTSVTIKADPTKNVRNIIKELDASNAYNSFKPDVVAINDQHQACGFWVKRGKEDVFICSAAGMQGITLDRRGANSGISTDVSHKKMTSRGEAFRPASTTFVKTDIGSWRVDFFNKPFLERMSISPERVTVAVLCDWQTGSTTMRPDLQIKLLDYIAHELLPKGKVHLVFLGDIIQGLNYQGMYQENRHIGLLSVDDQQEFVRTFILNTFKSLPASSLANITGIDIVPGNHEWNSGHTWLGTSHSLYLKHVFETICLLKRVSIPINLHHSPIETGGAFFRLFAGFAEVAGYGLLLNHIVVEKGAKGASGPAVYGAKIMLDGLGGLLEKVLMILFGHWHNPQYWLTVDKLALGSGSLADLSGYEFARAYRPHVSSNLLHLGGNKPPTLEVLTEKTLLAHKNKGFYSDRNLKDMGLINDPNFIAEIHGSFNRFVHPLNAIQKHLWLTIDQLISGKTSSF